MFKTLWHLAKNKQLHGTSQQATLADLCETSIEMTVATLATMQHAVDGGHLESPFTSVAWKNFHKKHRERHDKGAQHDPRWAGINITRTSETTSEPAEHPGVFVDGIGGANIFVPHGDKGVDYHAADLVDDGSYENWIANEKLRDERNERTRLTCGLTPGKMDQSFTSDFYTSIKSATCSNMGRTSTIGTTVVHEPNESGALANGPLPPQPTMQNPIQCDMSPSQILRPALQATSVEDDSRIHITDNKLIALYSQHLNTSAGCYSDTSSLLGTTPNSSILDPRSITSIKSTSTDSRRYSVNSVTTSTNGNPDSPTTTIEEIARKWTKACNSTSHEYSFQRRQKSFNAKLPRETSRPTSLSDDYKPAKNETDAIVTTLSNSNNGQISSHRLFESDTTGSPQIAVTCIAEIAQAWDSRNAPMSHQYSFQRPDHHCDKTSVNIPDGSPYNWVDEHSATITSVIYTKDDRTDLQSCVIQNDPGDTIHSVHERSPLNIQTGKVQMGRVGRICKRLETFFRRNR